MRPREIRISAQRHPFQGGLSLAELVVAGLLFGLCVVALTTVYRVSQDVKKFLTLREQAVTLLQHAIDGNSDFHYTTLSAYNTIPNSYNYPNCSMRDENGAEIACQLSLQTITTAMIINGTNVPFKKIVATVAWGTESLTDTLLTVPY